MLSHNFLDLDVETGVENGRLLAQLSAFGEVLSQRYSRRRELSSIAGFRSEPSPTCMGQTW